MCLFLLKKIKFTDREEKRDTLRRLYGRKRSHTLQRYFVFVLSIQNVRNDVCL